MSLVNEIDSEDAPVVLIVDNNQMSVYRLREIFKTKDFKIEVCEDGDLAVDEYIRLDPELVVLALDIPSLDGHLAALEMREHGGESRIVFTAPRRLSDLAKDAAFSAGAVAVLEAPVSRKIVDEAWSDILGPIPEAPGLADIDELYPERENKAPELPPLPLPGAALPLPNLPLPGTELPAIPIQAIQEPITPVPEITPAVILEEPKKKKSLRRKLVLLLVLAGISTLVYGFYINGIPFTSLA